MTQFPTTLRRAPPRAARAAGSIRRARLAVAFAGALCAALPGFAEPVRVLTFNILSSYLGADKAGVEETARVKRWEQRAPLVIEVMRDHPDGSGPYDFIGTQETSVHPDPALHQARRLAEALPAYGSLYAPIAATEEKFNLTNMIFHRKDRWEMDAADRGTIWFSKTPDVPGSATRCLTHALFHEINSAGRTGLKVYLFNTHLAVHSADARFWGAHQIMKRIQDRRDKTAPVILTGDFNARDGSVPVEYLSGNKVEFHERTYTPPLALVEAFRAANPNQTPPKIDRIFITDGLVPVSARIITTPPGAIRPSDHSPVEAILEFAPKNRANSP
jgi:endonuclease/exonuclease/phosphatase family metal-dependent hydrolase